MKLAALAVHAQQVWDDRVEDVLPALLRAAGTCGGARPKALIGLRADGGPGIRHGEGELPAGWHAWLVKFPPPTDDASPQAGTGRPGGGSLAAPLRRLVHAALRPARPPSGRGGRPGAGHLVQRR